MLDQRQRLKLFCNTLGNKHNSLNYVLMVQESLAHAKPLIIAPNITNSMWDQLSHDKKLNYFERLDEELKDDIERLGVAVRKLTTLDNTVLIKTKVHELYVTLIGDEVMLREQGEL